jgi:hypothetical protein
MEALLWLLAILWGVLLFGGFLLGQEDRQNNRRMPTWTRMASSIALVGAGWVWYLQAANAKVAGYALLIALGMTLGFIGDLFMAHLLPLAQAELGGIAAFGLGHIAYIAAMLQLGNQAGLDASVARWGGLASWLFIGLVGWYFVVFRGQKAGVLHFAALPYALLLSSTAGFATGLGLQSAPFLLVALGAASFLISDLLIAAQLFNGLKFKLIGDVIWLTYGPAQFLIVYSVGFGMSLV